MKLKSVMIVGGPRAGETLRVPFRQDYALVKMELPAHAFALPEETITRAVELSLYQDRSRRWRARWPS